MNSFLFTYEEVCEKINERVLPQFEREDAADKFLWQFEKNGSSLQVSTIMQNRYVIYATEKDYNFIKKKADFACRGIVIRETKKEEIEMVISQYEEVSSKAILFIKNGNRTLNQETFDRHQPHEILFFTNDNLEFVLDAMEEKEREKEKAKSVSSKPVMHKAVTLKKVELPELTDEEVREVYPEGCVVTHGKYGEGTVITVAGGKITVIFNDDSEKIFAARVCIDKKLLTIVA